MRFRKVLTLVTVSIAGAKLNELNRYMNIMSDFGSSALLKKA